MVVIVLVCALVLVALAAYGQMQSEEYAGRGVGVKSAVEVGGEGVPAAGDTGFSFALTWNCYGVSSYDSKTRTLIKENDTAHTEDFTAQLVLSEADAERIRRLLGTLDINSYPDKLSDEIMCEPPGALNLTVREGGAEKTVICYGLYPEYKTDDERLALYLSVCGELIGIITSTYEWRSLPDWEVYYD